MDADNAEANENSTVFANAVELMPFWESLYLSVSNR